MKKKLIISILVVIGVVVLGVLSASLINKFQKNGDKIVNIKYPLNESNQEENSNCLEKGKICSDDAIVNGIQVTVKISDKETKDFYVISNDETKMTLLSKDLVKDKTQWYFQDANFFGPNTILEVLYMATNNWTNIDVISDYKYDDKGYQLYRDVCVNHTLQFEGYNCNNLSWGAGYRTFTITNGKGLVKTSHDTTYEMEGEKIRTRNITVEEIEKLIGSAKKEITWLKNIKPFWTLTSASDPLNNYFEKAYAVRNNASTDSGIEVYPYNVTNEDEVGLRAVITIDKLEGKQ